MESGLAVAPVPVGGPGRRCICAIRSTCNSRYGGATDPPPRTEAIPYAWINAVYGSEKDARSQGSFSAPRCVPGARRQRLWLVSRKSRVNSSFAIVYVHTCAVTCLCPGCGLGRFPPATTTAIEAILPRAHVWSRSEPQAQARGVVPSLALQALSRQIGLGPTSTYWRDVPSSKAWTTLLLCRAEHISRVGRARPTSANRLTLPLGKARSTPLLRRVEPSRSLDLP